MTAYEQINFGYAVAGIEGIILLQQLLVVIGLTVVEQEECLQ